MGNSPRWTSEQLAEYQRRKGITSDVDAKREDAGNRNRPQAPNVEPDSSPFPEAQNAVEAFDSRVDIKIHSIRRRRTDTDGISAKWAIDGLIACGIITDDGPDYVRSVTFTQELGRPEKTIITITT